MNNSIAEKVRKDDRAKLYAMPEFRRLLFDIAEASAIAKSTREDKHSLLLEGKRSLGLEILSMFADGRGTFGVIADSVEAQNQFTKGAKND